MKPIFIIGYMGVGKSTFGRNLAKALGREFIDLDFYIEQRFRRSVRELFAERGEEGFRLLEHNMLHEVATMEDVVVSCGGGTPCFFDNIDHMNASGLTVLLEAGLPCLVARLSRGKAKRPLIANMDDSELEAYIVENLKKRDPWYSKARIRFCGNELEDRRQIDQTVAAFLEKHGNKIQ